MKIHITAPLLSKSGYGVHARQIFQWAEHFAEKYDAQLTVNSTNWGATGWYLHPDTLDGLTGRIMSRVGLPQSRVDLHVFVGLPNETANDWKVKAKKTVLITAGVESTQANPVWAKFINIPNVDLVITPSTFTKKGLVAAGCASGKIKVIPEATSKSASWSKMIF
jgi:hypothetical protein